MESMKLELKDSSDLIMQYENEKKDHLMIIEDLKEKYENQILLLKAENDDLKAKLKDMTVKIKKMTYLNGQQAKKPDLDFQPLITELDKERQLRAKFEQEFEVLHQLLA